MKLFMEPAIEVAKFAVEDIITVSGGNDAGDDEPEYDFPGEDCF